MSQLVEVMAGGVRWAVVPEYRQVLIGPEGLRLEDWLRGGQARLVKHGPHRTVYRVRLPGLDFHLKHYRLMDARAWLRQLFRPAKARMEYDRTLAVAVRRVPTVAVLGLGTICRHGGPGESFLITLTLDEAQPLDVFTETTLPAFEPSKQARVRQRLAVALGRLVARLHDAGIVHNDLHAGNLLVRLTGANQPELCLIDLHAVRLCQPLGWRPSRANLVMLNRWFMVHASRTDRRRFWRAYCEARKEEIGERNKAKGESQGALSPFAFRLSPSEVIRDLEKRTWRSNLRFWRRRDRRCLGTNRYYQRVRSAAGAVRVSGHAVRGLDPAGLARLLANPDEPFCRPGIKLLKNSRSSTVAEFSLAVDGVARRVVYKRFQPTRWSQSWSAVVRQSPALRSWVLGHGLRERGLPTARPLAVFQRWRGGWCREAYLLTEKVEDAVDLHGFVAWLDGLDAGRRRQIQRRDIEQLASLVREFHRRRLSQRDLKASNILVRARQWAVEQGVRGQGSGVRSSDAWPLTPDPSPLASAPPTAYCPRPTAFWLIDLVGMVRCRKLRRRRRVQNLARLNASFHQARALTRTDRLRFLRVYLQWNLFGRQGWKRWWREIALATQAKVRRNAARGRPLA